MSRSSVSSSISSFIPSSAVAFFAFAAALLSVLELSVVDVSAHPTYARNKTLLCTTLNPGHHGTPQQDATFPEHFKLTGKVESKEAYTVKVEAIDKDFGIKGYMIQARDACTGELLKGQWTTAQADQILNCNGADGLNAVHHRPKVSPAVASVTHSWSPIDKAAITSLNFMGTIVHKKDTYWVKQIVNVVPCDSTKKTN